MITMSQLDYTPALSVEKVDLNGLIQDVNAALLPTAEQRSLTITPYLDQRLQPISANYDQLRSLFTNLIENSLQYTLHGGVTVRTHAAPGSILVEVSDTGIGIEPDDLERIFDRFYRAHSARHLRASGTGLGLAIVRRIIELHGGSIAVHSQPGAGSTFTIRLPSA
jgi:signal transduction histidine kinase